MNRLYSGFLILIFSLLAGQITAQLSEGGVPLKIKQLKSSRGSRVEMPSFLSYFSNEVQSAPEEKQLKPFKFAHGYAVNLTTENSGEWFSAADMEDVAVWRLTIKSPEAYSLNLVFDDFEMPEKSRLFVYSETEEYLLGAFTSDNNAASRKFAIAPVAGDEITVQYEVPEEYRNIMPFRIMQVNHDFVGILKSGIRRPMGKTAGTCNIDINCDTWSSWEETKNSVVRIMINKPGGTEICTGVLVNNTAENEKPYVLTAAHCYDKWSYAETSVYTFNYESPFCKPLDGDPSNSLSGSVMKAQFDSIDFALVQLNTVPPPEYRPYYAGWDRAANAPESSVSIHHPQGDIKKLSHDNDPSVIATFDIAYTKNGHLRVLRWEGGTTEQGSSGGPLFDQNKLLKGTLTGGSAVCGKSIDDYFARFALAWDYKSDSTKQLKYWLDPLKKNPITLQGKQFNTDEDLCTAITNLADNDTYALVPVKSGMAFAGYWGGSNSVGITEVTEKFKTDANLHLKGLSMGVARIRNAVKNPDSEITIKIYNGTSSPDQLIYSQKVKTSALASDAMNYIPFLEVVKPGTEFFAGFEISNVAAPDSFAIYQSLKASTQINTCFIRKNNRWDSFTNMNAEKKTMTNIIELVACNINDFNTDTPRVENPLDIVLFPNPVTSTFIVEAGKEITAQQISVYNIEGRLCECKITPVSDRKLNVDMRGNVSGIYFVHYNSGTSFTAKKISFVQW
mgnify:CR=1 FL=1